MENYKIEAKRESMEGKITLGSRIGYSGERVFGLTELIIEMDKVNKERESNGKRNLPCVVKEGVLVGRASDSSYKENIFELEFSVSPRTQEIKPNDFYRFLIEYADKIGNAMKQERFYVNFGSTTSIIKSIK